MVTPGTGHTVFVSRDEDGRTRTKIIIQKRSYLDPGTETFPGENTGNDYAQLPNQSATSVLDNTAFGDHQTALPGAFTLPSRAIPGSATNGAPAKQNENAARCGRVFC